MYLVLLWGVRPELRPMGLHGGSETAKALDSSSTVDPVSISGKTG